MNTPGAFVMGITTWEAAGDLAFLIHFVADIHQPLHSTTSGDRGGTCQQVHVVPAEENLHYAWDDAVVTVLEKRLGTTDPETTARKFETLYPSTNELMTWKPGESEQIALESHELAETNVYQVLDIPERPCELYRCDAGTRTAITLTQKYMDQEAKIAGR